MLKMKSPPIQKEGQIFRFLKIVSISISQFEQNQKQTVVNIGGYNTNDTKRRKI